MSPSCDALKGQEAGCWPAPLLFKKLSAGLSCLGSEFLLARVSGSDADKMKQYFLSF